MRLGMMNECDRTRTIRHSAQAWRCAVVMALALCAIAGSSAADADRDGAVPDPGQRFKVDVLVVVAHPDDEMADLAGYLARIVFDQHRRVGVVFTTRGEESDSTVGPERGDALGLEREWEGRRALATLGITDVWFLNAPNTSYQNVLRSLERWDHGAILGQVVRLIRLTRPEVVISWLPAFTAGENHSDHQAAAVIAQEAFDTAADPAAFGEQLDSDAGEGKAAEGLQPWQAKKIYYYTDAIEYTGAWLKRPSVPSPYRGSFLEGRGPVYSAGDISPAKHVSYGTLAAEECTPYLSQDGARCVAALRTRTFSLFDIPMHFVLGKTLVAGAVGADVFEGTASQPITNTCDLSDRAAPLRERALEFGGPWAFYRRFWRAHGITNLADLLPVPEIALRSGTTMLRVPLLLRNDAAGTEEIIVRGELPAGWSMNRGPVALRVLPGAFQPIEVEVSVPDTSRPRWEELIWQASIKGTVIGTAKLRVYVAAGGAMPQ